MNDAVSLPRVHPRTLHAPAAAIMKAHALAAMRSLQIRVTGSATEADNEGRTALHHAADLGSAHDLISALNDMRRSSAALASAAAPDAADMVNQPDADGYTPLWLAAQRGDPEMVRLLLAAGAEVNLPGAYGATPLLVAACHGREAVVRLLVESGADVNAATVIGQTALDLAVERGHAAVVRALLEAGGAAGAAAERPAPLALGAGGSSVEDAMSDHGAPTGTDVDTAAGGAGEAHGEDAASDHGPRLDYRGVRHLLERRFPCADAWSGFTFQDGRAAFHATLTVHDDERDVAVAWLERARAQSCWPRDVPVSLIQSPHAQRSTRTVAPGNGLAAAEFTDSASVTLDTTLAKATEARWVAAELRRRYDRSYLLRFPIVTAEGHVAPWPRLEAVGVWPPDPLFAAPGDDVPLADLVDLAPSEFTFREVKEDPHVPCCRVGELLPDRVGVGSPHPADDNKGEGNAHVKSIVMDGRAVDKLTFHQTPQVARKASPGRGHTTMGALVEVERGLPKRAPDGQWQLWVTSGHPARSWPRDAKVLAPPPPPAPTVTCGDGHVLSPVGCANPFWIPSDVPTIRGVMADVAAFAADATATDAMTRLPRTDVLEVVYPWDMAEIAGLFANDLTINLTGWASSALGGSTQTAPVIRVVGVAEGTINRSGQAVQQRLLLCQPHDAVVGGMSGASVLDAKGRLVGFVAGWLGEYATVTPIREAQEQLKDFVGRATADHGWIFSWCAPLAHAWVAARSTKKAKGKSSGAGVVGAEAFALEVEAREAAAGGAGRDEIGAGAAGNASAAGPDTGPHPIALPTPTSVEGAWADVAATDGGAIARSMLEAEAAQRLAAGWGAAIPAAAGAGLDEAGTGGGEGGVREFN